MSAPLKDFRGKITVEADTVLEALNRATGRDKSEIARDVLHKWAVDQIHAASVMHRLLEAEGLPGIDSGAGGNARESQGIAGNRRESQGARGNEGAQRRRNRAGVGRGHDLGRRAAPGAALQAFAGPGRQDAGGPVVVSDVPGGPVGRPGPSTTRSKLERNSLCPWFPGPTVTA